MLSFDGKGISSCLLDGRLPLGKGIFTVSVVGSGISPASGRGMSELDGNGISAVDTVILLLFRGMIIGVLEVMWTGCSEKKNKDH